MQNSGNGDYVSGRKCIALLVMAALMVAFIMMNEGLSAAKGFDLNGSVEEFTAYLDTRIPKIMRDYQIPGVSIAIIHEKQMVWSNAYGYADIQHNRKMTVDTVCRVESISKPVTAWGVLKLAEDERIHLDDPLNQYLKNWELPESSFPVDSMTIRQLLSHTSGMPLGTIGLEYSPEAKIPSLEESLSKEATLIREPGTAFAYSNVGFNLLELLIQEVTGQRFSEYMEQEIFKPLGMKHANFDWSTEIKTQVPVGYDLKGNPVPVYVYAEKASGGLFANVEDLAHFMIAGMAGINNDGNLVLNPSSVNELYYPAVDIPGMYGMVSESYGLGYFIDITPDGKKAVFHGGQGHGWMTHFHSFPIAGEGIVILTNSQRSWSLIAYILRDWSRWSLATKVGMEIILLGMAAMWVVIGLTIMASLYLLLTTGGGIRKGRRSLSRLTKKTAGLGILQCGLGLALFAGVSWSMNQDYLFLSSLFPSAFPWLMYSICALAAGLVLAALFPANFARGKGSIANEKDSISVNRTRCG